MKFAWVLQDATHFQRAWPPDLVYNFSKSLYFTKKNLYLHVINSIIQLIGEFFAKNCLCRPKIDLFLLIDCAFTILVNVTMGTWCLSIMDYIYLRCRNVPLLAIQEQPKHCHTVLMISNQLKVRPCRIAMRAFLLLYFLIIFAFNEALSRLVPYLVPDVPIKM